MMCMSSFRRLLIAAAFLAFVPASHAQTSPLTPDIPAKYEAPTDTYDYVKRDVMIPMRDGVKLYTVIVIPKGAKNAPIILTRTPYNASKRAERTESPHMLAILPQGDEVFVAGRLHPRLPGRARQVQIRGRLRHDAARARPAQPHRDRPLSPTPTTPSTGW